MSKLKEGAGCAMIEIAYPVMGILGLVIHVWTIVIAFNVSGLLGAIITLVIPVIAQIYWFIKVWSFAGTVLNFYCLSILVYLGCWITVMAGMVILSSSE